MKLYILRGLPGSGKSTLVETLLQAAYGDGETRFCTAVCSADKYFIDFYGNYVFNAEKLGAAHEQSRRECEEALQKSLPVVIVDNTNTTRKEYAPYIKMGEQYGYDVTILTVDDAGEEAVQTACERNVHGVPREAIERMARRFQFDKIT